jgi:GNAT superfamily N-acetyltransferase
VIRRCRDEDWRDVRRLHIKLALGFPLVVDVELNDVMATPDVYWQSFVQACARDVDQALFVAEAHHECVGMGQLRVEGDAARLDMLFVDSTWRRQGLGAALMAAQAQWAYAAGVTGLICHIPDASAATWLAEGLGWRRDEEIFSTRRGLKEHKWSREASSDTHRIGPKIRPTE